MITDPLSICSIQADRRRALFCFLTFLIVVTCIELGARGIEQVENIIARRRNPFVESVNPVPAFEVVEAG